MTHRERPPRQTLASRACYRSRPTLGIAPAGVTSLHLRGLSKHTRTPRNPRHTLALARSRARLGMTSLGGFPRSYRPRLTYRAAWLARSGLGTRALPHTVYGSMWRAPDDHSGHSPPAAERPRPHTALHSPPSAQAATRDQLEPTTRSARLLPCSLATRNTRHRL